MKMKKRILALSLCLCLAAPAVLPASAAPVTENPITAPAVGPAKAPAERPSYEGYTLTEDFENGLDRWETVYMGEDYIDDFAIVEDPSNPDENVLYFSYQGAFLYPLDEVWPEDGMLKSVSFRMRFLHNDFGLLGSYLPFIYRDNDNIMGSTMTAYWNNTYGFWGKYRGRIDGESTSGNGAPDCKPFLTTDWFDVTINYSEASINAAFTDSDGNIVTVNAPNPFPDGRFVLGLKNYQSTNTQNLQGSYYIDDLEITFAKLSVDVDEPQTDVNVYYAGNTFYEPGDTLSIIGEQFYETVESTAILKLPDTALSADLNRAVYINEGDYEHAVESNIDWATLQGRAVASSERELPIVQRTKLGLKVTLPEDDMYAQRGIYAILLRAREETGQDAIVIVNNPYISLLLSDDGGEATPNGWLRLAGYNISVQNDASKVTAVIMDKNGGNRVKVDASRLHVDTTESAKDQNGGRDNDYRLTVDLDGLPAGEYQIMVHNGYGGDLGWSMPHAFTVKDEAAYATWRDISYFDVKKDFGAVGDAAFNDTAAIIAALNAAQKAGGGTVYFPNGYYRITDTLYVPENVSLIGAGTYQSCIYFDAENWLETPEAMIYYEDNVEISDLYFYGSIARSLFKENAARAGGEGRLYLRNIQCMFDPVEYCSDGRGALMEGYTSLQAQLYIKEQSTNKGFSAFKGAYVYGDLISVENCDFYYNPGYLDTDGNMFNPHADYIYCKNTKWYGWSNITSLQAAFVEDCEYEACLNWYGNTVLVDSVAKNSTSNNRELLTTDGKSQYINQVIQDLNDPQTVQDVLAEELPKLSADMQQQLQDYLNSNQGRVYRFVSTKVYWNGETACTLYVTEGQGAGQARCVDENILQAGNYSYFTVRTPFAVSPNKNSRVSFYGDRTQFFALNSDFSNGRHVGTYGTMVDAVFDGLHFNHATSGIELQTNNGALWYITSKDTLAENIITGHTDTVEVKASGLANFAGSSVQNTYFGIQFRRNTVGEGGHYRIDQITVRNSTSEIIFEDNLFVSKEGNGFRKFFLSGNDGIWISGNRQLTDADDPNSKTELFDDYSISMLRSVTITRYGYYSTICDQYQPTGVIGRMYGDVNNDGKVSLKDVTLIRFYLAEQVSETEIIATYGSDALKYADCDNKSGVDSRDIFEIYKYLLNPITYKGAVGTSDAPSVEPEPEELQVYNDNLTLDYSNCPEEGAVEDPANPRLVLDYSGVADQD